MKRFLIVTAVAATSLSVRSRQWRRIAATASGRTTMSLPTSNRPSRASIRQHSVSASAADNKE